MKKMKFRIHLRFNVDFLIINMKLQAQTFSGLQEKKWGSRMVMTM